ncbi:NACHT domain-containing protein [Bradyrhizobium ontarionense]|uniref:NACHT domain-containing protein n=1 Tax=Bradyrhizobium ontarionense TaxID=2898149 RepID=A0ABY3R9I0_9BRAD|nr:NACHT domain-containing protein [Bradyrhizobium sp. A19]UFZ04030.1 NACHT domain-containing protein [Bradyrhizobium sp. A19]
MSADGIELRLTGKAFKLEFSQMLGSILEAGARALATIKTGGAWIAVAPNAISGLFGVFKGFKSEETQELRAWLLVSGGLAYALEKAVAETAFKTRPPPESLRKLVEDIGARIESRTYTVEPDFFQQPNRLQLIDDVSHELSAWGSQFGGEDKPPEAKKRILSHFPTGLHRTWLKDARRFEALEQALNSPFTASMKIQRELSGYLQYIEEQFTELRLIGQSEDDLNAVRLAQVFVPLRAFVESGQAKDSQPNLAIDSLAVQATAKERPTIKRKIVRVFDALDKWVVAASRKDALRVVSGGPGIGKSSSMRAYAAKLARSGVAYPIFVPLQKLVRPDVPLRERLREYLIEVKEIPFSAFPLETASVVGLQKPFLIIFDGLDELVRPGKDADEIAREFMIDLRSFLDQENGLQSASPISVLALVTGRVAVAGSAARVLKCSGEQILSLLRFSEELRHQNSEMEEVDYDDPAGLLREDQRRAWWKLWQKATRDVPEEMPATLLHRDLYEVTIEPLLLYFIALIRPWVPSRIGDSLARNSIYAKLLRYFYERECGKGDRNFATEFPAFEEYEVVLQAMALAAWYDGSTRIGSIETVEKLLGNWSPDVAHSFRKVIGGNKPAVSAALAFYMRPHEAPNSFEFLHKTFAEYLVSRRIVEAVATISEAFEDAKRHRGVRKKTFDESEQLKDWIRLAGGRALDFDLIRFLRDEVYSCFLQSSEMVVRWREVLVFCMQGQSC